MAEAGCDEAAGIERKARLQIGHQCGDEGKLVAMLAGRAKIGPGVAFAMRRDRQHSALVDQCPERRIQHHAFGAFAPAMENARTSNGVLPYRPDGTSAR
jgi:hypothetical protein